MFIAAALAAAAGAAVAVFLLHRVAFPGFHGEEIAKIPEQPAARADEASDSYVSGLMAGNDESCNERWMDSADAYYSPAFRGAFSYTDKAKRRPEVRVMYRRSGVSLQGRLFAKGLKPNFTYQMKLVGDYGKDPKGSEMIGGLGRWRLPGFNTNYSDAQYLRYPQKNRVEAYIFFDYFVTDRDGNAEKNFRLMSTLHVLFNPDTQLKPRKGDSRTYYHLLFRDNSQAYEMPDRNPAVLRVWGQWERAPGRPPLGQVRLPKREYQAFFALTEESFHSEKLLGGRWATVMKMPVRFSVE